MLLLYRARVCVCVSLLRMFCDHVTIKALTDWKSEAERLKERQRAW